MASQRKFAEGTEVPASKSETELRQILLKNGATQIYSGWDEKQGVVIGFTVENRMVKLSVPMPTDLRGTVKEREERRRWRCLVLALKAKFTVVEAGISTFEREFFADIMLPDRRTIGDWVAPQVADIYKSGKMPGTLLLGPMTSDASSD